MLKYTGARSQEDIQSAMEGVEVDDDRMVKLPSATRLLKVSFAVGRAIEGIKILSDLKR